MIITRPVHSRGHVSDATFFRRVLALPVLDTGALVLAWLAVGSLFVRLWSPMSLVLLLGVLALQLVIGTLGSLYRHRFVLGSDSELRHLGACALVMDLLGVGLAYFLGFEGSLAGVLLTLLVAQLVMIFGRQFLRMTRDLMRRPQRGQAVVVLGAGDLGTTLASLMQRDPDSEYRPVAFLDDDPRKANLVVAGVPVRGTRADAARVLEETGAAGVVVAINEVAPEVFTSLVHSLDTSAVWVRTAPSLPSMLSSEVDLSAIRSLNVSDLLGRSLIDPEDAEIAALVAGRTVLVTGAGGSIGSELCRIIHRNGPGRLVMLDRDESELHSLSMSIEGRALMDSPDLVLADIRDADALDRVFAEVRPDIVFHAAALKHLPMLERYPLEGWKTNVHGSLNVLRAAADHGVERFVNISTDKAANPSSELGRSKFVAERLTADFARRLGLPYVSVRFGNVLGSRGSVLVSFAEQIRRGEALTITDPEVTRFFMSIPEACVLVLRAAGVGRPGQTLVLDMGEPVRIVDLAHRAMALAGRTCPIVYTGLREGEKMHEELFSPEETGAVLANGVASAVDIAPIAPASLPAPGADEAAVRAAYGALVPEQTTGSAPRRTHRAGVGELHPAVRRRPRSVPDLGIASSEAFVPRSAG